MAQTAGKEVYYFLDVGSYKASIRTLKRPSKPAPSRHVMRSNSVSTQPPQKPVNLVLIGSSAEILKPQRPLQANLLYRPQAIRLEQRVTAPTVENVNSGAEPLLLYALDGIQHGGRNSAVFDRTRHQAAGALQWKGSVQKIIPGYDERLVTAETLKNFNFNQLWSVPYSRIENMSTEDYDELQLFAEQNLTEIQKAANPNALPVIAPSGRNKRDIAEDKNNNSATQNGNRSDDLAIRNGHNSYYYDEALQEGRMTFSHSFHSLSDSLLDAGTLPSDTAANTPGSNGYGHESNFVKTATKKAITSNHLDGSSKSGSSKKPIDVSAKSLQHNHAAPYENKHVQKKLFSKGTNVATQTNIDMFENTNTSSYVEQESSVKNGLEKSPTLNNLLHNVVNPEEKDDSAPQTASPRASREADDTAMAVGVVVRTVHDGDDLLREEGATSTGRRRGGCCRHGPRAWCKKYFWEGQKLSGSQVTNQPEGASSWHHRHRRVLGLLLPALLFHVCWWGLAIKYRYWPLFIDKYFMTLTMIGGSIVAGMTSEGGGAIAFPVMTLAFQISPTVARDFSLMIQSCGMSAAAFAIFFMRIKVEWKSLVFCSLGGAIGIVFGFYQVDPVLSPSMKKMIFVSIWFSFAFALFLLNRLHKRRTFDSIPRFGVWRAGVLLLTGLLGGVFSSFAGSGLDICSFSMLTLLFRVSEKVATPTSVVLMAGNTLMGFYWRGVMADAPISAEAWEFLAVCVPVVVLGAPLGSVLGSHFHRQVLAAFVYIIDVAALVGAYVIVPLTPVLIGTSVGIIVGGFIFFGVITYIGQRILRSVEGDNLPQPPEKTNFADSSKAETPKQFSNPLFDEQNQISTRF